MKITFILPGIQLSGGLRVIFEYANRLKEGGHNVNLLYPLITIPGVYKLSLKSLTRYLDINNIQINNEVNWFNPKVKLSRIWTLNVKYVKLVEKQIPDADIIIASSWETANLVNKLNEKKGQKFYLIQHYEIWDIWSNERCWRKAEKIERNPSKRSLAMYDVIPENKELRRFKNLVDTTYKLPLKKIVISSFLKDLIEEKFGEKVEALISNGVNHDNFYRDDSPERENLKICKICTPCEHFMWKGVADGIKAFKIVKNRYPDIEFVMYGAKRIKDTPKWIKVYERLLNDEELRKLYNNSHIFVYPSWTEGFGLPPMEAMACGCAVVSTDVGAIPDYAINNKTVLTSPPRDPKALANNIIKLIENKDKRNKIAENGYNHVKKFAWARSTDKLENVLKKYC